MAMRLLESVTVVVVMTVTWVEPLVPWLRAPDAMAFVLADQHSSLACRKLGWASSDDPACEPAKFLEGSLMVMRLLESVTAMVAVMVTRVEPLVPRCRAPDATAFALAGPRSSLACRKLGGASSGDPARDPAKVAAGSLLVTRLLESVTVMVVVVAQQVEPLV